MIFKSGQTRHGEPAWLDTVTRHERGCESDLPRRELQALRVFRLRIERLLAERTLLEQRLAASEAARRSGDQSAREEGFAAGRLQGRREMEQELAGGFSLLGMLEREFRAAAVRYHREADGELVRLARWMSERVLHRQLAGDDSRLERLVRALLAHWVGEGVYRFRLHPEDRRRLLATPAAQRLQEDAAGRIEWVEAAEVPPGGCRLELAAGIVDTAPAELLAHLEGALLKDLARRPDAELPAAVDGDPS
jgi:flagellar biosynthesis/type III secretory pathway protein FliH